MSESVDFGWMRVVLTSLFDDIPATDASRAIKEPEKFSELRSSLQTHALDAGKLGRIPVGDYGDNLVMALLALRVKFERSEAFSKLETNIAMRTRRSN